MRFNAVLSAFNMDLAGPLIAITVVPFFMAEPSATNIVGLQSHKSKIVPDSDNPLAITSPSFLQTIFAFASIHSSINALLVMSPVPMSSFKKLARIDLLSMSFFNEP